MAPARFRETPSFFAIFAFTAAKDIERQILSEFNITQQEQEY